MKEGEVKAGFCLHGGNGSITEPRYSGWVEEKPTMRFEGERLDAIDDNFGCAIFIGDIYRSRPVFIVQPRVCPDQLATLFTLMVSLLPPSSGSLGTQDNRGQKGQSREDSRRTTSIANFGSDDIGPLVGKSRKGIFGRGVSQRGLCCHDG